MNQHDTHPDKNPDKNTRDKEYRRRILEAAGKLVECGGIDSVNMYQIAQEAGIGQGTLYRRYSHPGEVYSDLLLTSIERFLHEIETYLADPCTSDSAVRRLDEIIRRLVYYIDENAELLTFITCMYAGKQHFSHDKRPYMKRLHGILRETLSSASEQGELHRFDPDLTTNLLLAVLSPEQYKRHRDTLGYGKEQYLAGVRRLFIEGLRNPDL